MVLLVLLLIFNFISEIDVNLLDVLNLISFGILLNLGVVVFC